MGLATQAVDNAANFSTGTTNWVANANKSSQKSWLVAIAIAFMFSLSACSNSSDTTDDGSSGGNGGNNGGGSTNTAPVANAGADQNVVQGDLVTLNGSNSSDADGDTLTYSWSFSSTPNGSSAQLNSSSAQAPTFTADVAGSYQIQLVVNDGTVDSSADSVTITATAPQTNVAPTANAGDNKTTYTDNTVTLDGSGSSDANGDSLSYAWTLDQKPAASTTILSNADQVNASLTPDVEGSYVISLVVNDGQENSTADSVVINVAQWQINTVTRSTNIQESGQGVLVNVQSVTTTVENNEEFTTFNATGVPDYTVTITQDDIDTLNNRPNAASDFRTPSGRTFVNVGDVVEFGEDIGYTRSPGCDLGYWPPGPECPSNQSVVNKIPTQPEPASQTCNTGLNSIGVMLNGTSVFNWDDGSSYNNQNVWNNLAPKFEVYDVDMCLGHAQQQGNYHHHMFSKCLQELMGDDGSSHSPIYGFAADGYPIYGPYFSQGVLAKSAWVMRDYDDPNSASGCGVAGERSCQLVDQYDLSQGTTSVTSGPTTAVTVTSMSGNPIDASEGIYFEDYYYDSGLTSLGGEYLDQHNGHDHDDLGYHYHITVEEVSGALSPVFPYQVGPTFYGRLPSGGIANCQ